MDVFFKKQSKLSIFVVTLILFTILIYFLYSLFLAPKIIYDIKDFRNDLDKIGQKYSYIDIAKSDFGIYMSVSPKIIKIYDTQICIYEFRTVDDADKQVRQIDKTGTTIGKFKDIDWNAEPHFYKKGNIIVQYIGNNQNLIRSFKEILGTQFAGV